MFSLDTVRPCILRKVLLYKSILQFSLDATKLHFRLFDLLIYSAVSPQFIPRTGNIKYRGVAIFIFILASQLHPPISLTAQQRQRHQHSKSP